MTSIRSLGRLAVLVLGTLPLFSLVGCDNPAPPPTTPAAPPTDAPAPKPPGEEVKPMPTEGAKKEAATDVKLDDKEMAAIKELPADEQTIALAQKVCPVSGSHLGSMDKPIKQVVDGKTFFLCCEGCESEVKKNPAAVLAKLPK